VARRADCVDNVGVHGCHTCFPKRNQVHLICALGSVYTHIIDKMSEISLTVFKTYHRV
jgi:hypothetical protein